jgi:hypothetical protein
MAWHSPHRPDRIYAALTMRLERLPTRTTEELMVFAGIPTDLTCPPLSVQGLSPARRAVLAQELVQLSFH